MSKKPPTLWADCPDLTGCLKPALAVLRPPEEVTHAGAEPVSRRPLTTEELELVVDAMLADLEALVVGSDWSGTELVSLVLGVAYRLFAAIEDPADRLRLWREFAATIEGKLLPLGEVN
jgi:hypothetical protein